MVVVDLFRHRHWGEFQSSLLSAIQSTRQTPNMYLQKCSLLIKHHTQISSSGSVQKTPWGMSQWEWQEAARIPPEDLWWASFYDITTSKDQQWKQDEPMHKCRLLSVALFFFQTSQGSHVSSPTKHHMTTESPMKADIPTSYGKWQLLSLDTQTQNTDWLSSHT